MTNLEMHFVSDAVFTIGILFLYFVKRREVKKLVSENKKLKMDAIRPLSAGDNKYPNTKEVAKCLRNCEDDLETEARFVLWQGAEIKRLTNTIEEISNNMYEISGIIADVEHGNGFDEVCLHTLKRVETSLRTKKGPKWTSCSDLKR